MEIKLTKKGFIGRDLVEEIIRTPLRFCAWRSFSSSYFLVSRVSCLFASHLFSQGRLQNVGKSGVMHFRACATATIHHVRGRTRSHWKEKEKKDLWLMTSLPDGRGHIYHPTASKGKKNVKRKRHMGKCVLALYIRYIRTPARESKRKREKSCCWRPRFSD